MNGEQSGHSRGGHGHQNVVVDVGDAEAGARSEINVIKHEVGAVDGGNGGNDVCASLLYGVGISALADDSISRRGSNGVSAALVVVVLCLESNVLATIVGRECDVQSSVGNDGLGRNVVGERTDQWCRRILSIVDLC